MQFIFTILDIKSTCEIDVKIKIILSYAGITPNKMLFLSVVISTTGFSGSLICCQDFHDNNSYIGKFKKV